MSLVWFKVNPPSWWVIPWPSEWQVHLDLLFSFVWLGMLGLYLCLQKTLIKATVRLWHKLEKDSIGKTGVNKASLGPTVLQRCSGTFLSLYLTCIQVLLFKLHTSLSLPAKVYSVETQLHHLPQCCPHSKRLSCLSALWSLPRAPIINYHKLSGLDDRNVFSCNSMGQKSEIKVSVGSGSLLRGEPCLPFQLHVAPNTPWLKTTLIPYLPVSSHGSLSSISYKDIYH